MVDFVLVASQKEEEEGEEEEEEEEEEEDICDQRVVNIPSLTITPTNIHLLATFPMEFHFYHHYLILLRLLSSLTLRWVA